METYVCAGSDGGAGPPALQPKQSTRLFGQLFVGLRLVGRSRSVLPRSASSFWFRACGWTAWRALLTIGPIAHSPFQPSSERASGEHVSFRLVGVRLEMHVWHPTLGSGVLSPNLVSEIRQLSRAVGILDATEGRPCGGEGVAEIRLRNRASNGSNESRMPDTQTQTGARSPLGSAVKRLPRIQLRPIGARRAALRAHREGGLALRAGGVLGVRRAACGASRAPRRGAGAACG